MLSLPEAEDRYDALRERDRMIASLQSKQRMLDLFEHLLDEEAREQVELRLREALDDVRARARELALELARAAFVELEIDDLRRITDRQRQFAEYLDQQPSERLDVCHDLLTFLREMRQLRSPPKRTVEDLDR